LATGFVMVDMVDPSRQTDVVRAYSYRQIITRPIIGGGFLTALSVPLIDAVGLPALAIATAALYRRNNRLGHKAGIGRALQLPARAQAFGAVRGLIVFSSSEAQALRLCGDVASTGGGEEEPEQAGGRLAKTTTMHREMHMGFWLEKANAETGQLP